MSGSISKYGRKTLNICTPTSRTLAPPSTHPEPTFIMASSSMRDSKDIKITNPAVDDGVADVAVGSMEEHRPYTLSTFYRSVLFQMIMFGA
jgi:hypothetical protein